MLEATFPSASLCLGLPSEPAGEELVLSYVAVSWEQSRAERVPSKQRSWQRCTATLLNKVVLVIQAHLGAHCKRGR